MKDDLALIRAPPATPQQTPSPSDAAPLHSHPQGCSSIPAPRSTSAKSIVDSKQAAEKPVDGIHAASLKGTHPRILAPPSPSFAALEPRALCWCCPSRSIPIRLASLFAFVKAVFSRRSNDHLDCGSGPVGRRLAALIVSRQRHSHEVAAKSTESFASLCESLRVHCAYGRQSQTTTTRRLYYYYCYYCYHKRGHTSQGRLLPTIGDQTESCPSPGLTLTSTTREKNKKAKSASALTHTSPI